LKPSLADAPDQPVFEKYIIC